MDGLAKVAIFLSVISAILANGCWTSNFVLYLTSDLLKNVPCPSKRMK